MPALLAATIPAQQHSGGIEAAIAGQPHLRGAHPHVGPSFDGSKQRFEPARLSDRIVIQNGHESGLRFADALIDGRTKANIGFVSDHSNLASWARRVPPAIVHN